MIKYKIKNTDTKVGTSPVYFLSKVEVKSGDILLAMFTSNEIQRAVKRGDKLPTKEAMCNEL